MLAQNEGNCFSAITFLKIFWGGMPPDPPRGSALWASLLPLRGKPFSHSTPTKKLGIYGDIGRGLIIKG